jgi:hypothetical protein
MKLSILICTMPQRVEMFNAIHSKLLHQIETSAKGEVEVLANGMVDITTGHKRNLLMQEAKGEFVVFVDDDDDVYDWYVSEIVKTINENPEIDCIGTNGIISFNGENPRKWFISIAYQNWYESAEVYYRTPNHISPIRRTIASSIPFPNIYRGEDSAFSLAIHPLLKKEAIIEKPIYHYRFCSPIVTQVENGAPYRPAWR